MPSAQRQLTSQPTPVAHSEQQSTIANLKSIVSDRTNIRLKQNLTYAKSIETNGSKMDVVPLNRWMKQTPAEDPWTAESRGEQK
jgi:hypothetical protein